MESTTTQLAGGIDTDQTGLGVAEFRMPARPYPGLRPFKVSEWPIYFGREVMTQEVVDRLARCRMVVVHGASGCGKSSLIFAGVLPQLGRRRRNDLHFAEMRPGRAPLRTLAEALARGCDLTGPTDVDAVHLAISCGKNAAKPLEALLDRAGVKRLCLYVDQFEELFRFAQDVSAEEASLFIEVLMSITGTAQQDTLWWEKPEPLPETAPADEPTAEASTAEAPTANESSAGRVRLLLSMRSEFLGDCARFPGFAEVVNQTQYLLPNITHADLLRSILEPAELFDQQVERSLAERLAEEAVLEKDPLPLVQHALMELWKGDTKLTLERYDKAVGPGPGGLGRLLAAHADEVLDRHAGPDDPVAEQLFRALTDLDPAGRAIRRPQRLDRLLALVDEADQTRMRQTIDDFRAEDVAFVRPLADERPSPLAGDQIIDISHEALLRTWPRIADASLDPATAAPRGWLHREFEDGLIWRSLAVQARAFKEDPAACLDPATTGKRSAWYDKVGSRAAWANRHLIVRSDASPADEPEWRDVDALMAASNRERARDRKRTMLGLGFLAFAVVMTVATLVLTVVVLRADNAKQAQQEVVLKGDNTVLTNELVAQTESQASRSEIAAKPTAVSVQSADLAIWLGSDAQPNVHALEGSAAVVPSALKPGAQVRMITETVARSGFPDRAGYNLANGFGYLAKDAVVEIVAAPVAYQRGAVKQYWASARAQVISLGTVYIQFGGGSPGDTAALGDSRDKARKLRAGLERYGLTVPGEERVAVPAGINEVRYFHPEDRDRARLLASVVAQVANAARLGLREPAQKDMSQNARRTASGVLELWIDLSPPAATSKAKAKYYSSPVDQVGMRDGASDRSRG